MNVEDGPPILDEWETIARHLYRDCRRVVLTPLVGGFMSNTFRVASYDEDGRRLLPTVLKIGGLALTEREEAANRKYVQTFILNNSTTLLGEAVAATGPACATTSSASTAPTARSPGSAITTSAGRRRRWWRWCARCSRAC